MATLDQTAADIFDGKIVVDKNGSCTIDAKNNVIDNVAYVTIHLDGSKLILLRTWPVSYTHLTLPTIYCV